MAEDKKIQIKLAATGGDAAAREVGKVEVSLDDLVDKGRETKAALEAVAMELDKGGDEAVAAAADLRKTTAQLDMLEEKAIAATAAQKQLAATGPTVTRSQGHAGFAVLEFSRALEDAQYGIRGVINNIPTLVSYMGAGAGLAGAISIAVVAAAQLLPLLMDLGSASKEEAEKFEKAQESAADAAERLEKRLQALRQAKADAEAANVLDLGAAAVKRWKDEAAALDRTVAAYRAYQSAKLEELSAAAAIETARVNAAEAAGGMSRTDAIAARAAITEKAEAEALQVRQAAADQEIAFAEKRFALASAAQEDLEKSEINARRRADAAIAAAMVGEQAGPAFEAAQQRFDAAASARSLAQGTASALAMSSYGRETPQLAKARAELEAARAEEIRAKEALAAAQQLLESTDMAALAAREEAAVSALEAAQAAKESGEARLKTLREELKQETELIRLRQKSEADLAAMRSTERGIMTGSAVAAEQAQQREAARLAEIERQRQVLADDQRAAAPGFAARADRVEAKGFDAAAEVLEAGAADLANGAGLSGIEARLFQAAQVIKDVPESQRRMAEAALAPLVQELNRYKQRIEQIEAQMRNRPDRG